MSFDHVMATACVQTITLLYIYFCVWELDLRLNNINYSLILLIIYYHYLLILNLWNTIKFKHHNQWVAHLWYFTFHLYFSSFTYKSFSANLFITSSTNLLCLFSLSVPIITLSIKLTTFPVLMRSHRILFIMV